MRSVYIETTIPSFYFDTRSSPTIVTWRAATRKWWERCHDRYALCTSDLTFGELQAAPAEKAMAARKLLQSLRVLERVPGVVELARYYIDHHLMPADALGDAGHLAMASFHAVDFLLTWNCRHLANINKQRHLEVLNTRLGLAVPSIVTPLTLPPEVTR